MLPSTADHPQLRPPHHHRSQSLIQFTSADKIFSKLRPKHSASSDISTRNPSFRVYYNDSIGAIPFKWETTPGTPKHALFKDDYNSHRYVAPPLTPPPSFFKMEGESQRMTSSRKGLVSGFMPRRMKSVKTHSCDLILYDESGDLERKVPLRNWRSLSMVRFSMRFGKGEDLKLNSALSVLPKSTSFGGCFRA